MSECLKSDPFDLGSLHNWNHGVSQLYQEAWLGRSSFQALTIVDSIIVLQAYDHSPLILLTVSQA
jgi:hypothetical protein